MTNHFATPGHGSLPQFLIMLESTPPMVANEVANPLKKYLEKTLNIKQAPGHRLYCQVLTDNYNLEDWSTENIGPFLGNREYLLARQTVLVFQSGLQGAPAVESTSFLAGSGSPLKKRSTEYLLVFGFTACEYAWRDSNKVPSRVYIQYVDSTGLYRPRREQSSMTRTVLAAYLGYVREVLRVSSVHLLATPRPALLFPGSEMLPDKRPIDGFRLAAWWMALLHWTWDRTAHKDPTLCFVHSPSADFMPAFTSFLHTNTFILNRHATNGNIRWHAGYCFDDQKDIREEIPLFEDDPKWRHYEAGLTASSSHEDHRAGKRQKRESDRRSVREFFQTLPLRMEFHQDPSALIAVKFPENATSHSPSPYATIKNRELAAFAIKILKTLSFENETAATKSSMKVWSLLKLMGSTPLALAPAKDEISDEIEMSCCDDKDEASEDAAAFYAILDPLQTNMNNYAPNQTTNQTWNYNEAHDVQNLIRRKIPRCQTPL